MSSHASTASVIVTQTTKMFIYQDENDLFANLTISFVFNTSRCTSVAWVPNSDGAFVVAHADGNFYVYDKVNMVSY